MTSSANKYQFKRLEEIAESLIDWSEARRCKHYSFILHKKHIISIGTNKRKTHPTNLINKKFSAETGEDVSDQKHICSEFDAISKLKRSTNIDTKRCTLINLRYDRNKKIALALPCMSCRSLLKYFEFKTVIYTDNNGIYQTYK